MADASDDFNRANGALGANWTTFGSAPQIVSNTVRGTSGSNNRALYTAAAFEDDQYSEMEVRSTDSGHFQGVIVRGNAAAQTGYVAYARQSAGNKVTLFILTGGGEATGIDGDEGAAGNWTVGDVVRLGIVGNQLTVYRNGTPVLGPTTDSNIASGTPGIDLVNNNTSVGDNWLGGPIVEAGGSPEPSSRRMMQGRGGMTGGMQMKRSRGGVYVPEHRIMRVA